MQNANANEKPTRIPSEHLTNLDNSAFKVWYDNNRDLPFIQEWLRVIFNCLREKTLDQYRLWRYITTDEGFRFSLETLASILQSSSATSDEDPKELVAFRRSCLHELINMEAVSRAWTESECGFVILLGGNANFNLSLVDESELCRLFATLRFTDQAASVEQVLAVLKCLFQSWSPTRRLEFVLNCGEYQVGDKHSSLLAGAILSSTKEADQSENVEATSDSEADQSENVEATSDSEAVEELLKRADRYHSGCANPWAPLDT